MSSLLAAVNGSTEILRLVLGSMIWAEIVGVPIAWMQLRRTPEWAERPQGKGLEALARYVGRVTGMVGFFAIAVLLGAMLGGVAT